MIIKLFKYSWPSILVAAVIFYLSCLIPTDDVPKVRLIPHADKIVHFLMYFGLSFTTSGYYILMKRGEQINKKKIYFFAIFLPIIYGGLIEILQDRYFGRTGDWFDFLADALGSLASIPVALWFKALVIKYYKR